MYLLIILWWWRMCALLICIYAFEYKRKWMKMNAYAFMTMGLIKMHKSSCRLMEVRYTLTMWCSFSLEFVSFFLSSHGTIFKSYYLIAALLIKMTVVTPQSDPYIFMVCQSNSYSLNNTTSRISTFAIQPTIN